MSFIDKSRKRVDHLISKHNFRFRNILTAFFPLILFTYSFAQGADGEVAKINSINGKFIQYCADGDKDNAKKISAGNDAIGMKLFISDILITEAQTTLEIEMKCGAKIDVLENTEAQIGVSNVRVNHGGIWTNFKYNKNGSKKFEVFTPTATMGIKGTKFKTEYAPQKGLSRVWVVEGVVLFTASNGETAEVKAGESIQCDYSEMALKHNGSVLKINNIGDDTINNKINKNENGCFEDEKNVNLKPSGDENIINNKTSPFEAN